MLNASQNNAKMWYVTTSKFGGVVMGVWLLNKPCQVRYNNDYHFILKIIIYFVICRY